MAKPHIKGLDEGWEHAGEVAVDSGTLMIVDPINVSAGFKTMPGSPFSTWDGFCKHIGNNQAKQIGNNTAMAIAGFGGDGVYPVLIKRHAQTGLVIEIKVTFR
jgi:hypothetical protein